MVYNLTSDRLTIGLKTLLKTQSFVVQPQNPPPATCSEVCSWPGGGSACPLQFSPGGGRGRGGPRSRRGCVHGDHGRPRGVGSTHARFNVPGWVRVTASFASLSRCLRCSALSLSGASASAPHRLRPPGSLSTRVLQARVLGSVARPSSERASQPLNLTGPPALQADSLPAEPPGKTRGSVLLFNLVNATFLSSRFWFLSFLSDANIFSLT